MNEESPLSLLDAVNRSIKQWEYMRDNECSKDTAVLRLWPDDSRPESWCWLCETLDAECTKCINWSKTRTYCPCVYIDSPYSKYLNAKTVTDEQEAMEEVIALLKSEREKLQINGST